MAQLAIAFAAVALASRPAAAELGGNYESVLHDKEVLHASLTVEQNPAYTTYILDNPDGTVVREYLSPHAGVFAVDWSGYGRRPNMRQILGPYFARFARPRNMPHQPHNATLQRIDPDLVLESRGAMRHFSGRAYLPADVPQEVSIADVH